VHRSAARNTWRGPAASRFHALTVPGESTRLTGRPRQSGNCAPTRFRTTAAEIGNSSACMVMAASLSAGGAGPQSYFLGAASRNAEW
jgi:hypothetical protein